MNPVAKANRAFEKMSEAIKNYLNLCSEFPVKGIRVETYPDGTHKNTTVFSRKKPKTK